MYLPQPKAQTRVSTATENWQVGSYEHTQIFKGPNDISGELGQGFLEKSLLNSWVSKRIR